MPLTRWYSIDGPNDTPMDVMADNVFAVRRNPRDPFTTIVSIAGYQLSVVEDRETVMAYLRGQSKT